MIFTTKNEELAIFGKTIDDIKNKIDKFNEVKTKNGLFGENGALASLFSGKKLNNILTPETLKQFDEFKKKFNSSSLSAEALAEQMENVDQRIIDYAKTCKNGEMTTEGFKASVEGMTLSAKAGKVALQALAMAGNMIAMWGISEVIYAIHSCITASDRLKESAKDLGSQFSSTKSDIEVYKSKINDLYKTINDSSSSYEDTYNARKELLAIQDEMIEKFGSEAEAVELVTSAIHGNTEAFDDLTKQKWQETVNEFTNGSDKKWTERVGDSWANLWSGASNNFDRMIKEMENTEVSFRVIPRYDDEGTYEEFSNKLKENFGASITHTERDDVFTLSGDLDDIYDQLLNIQSLATNMGIDDSFLPDLSRQADETKKTLESYQEIYNQHILYDKIFDSDAYEKSFNDINDAYKKYQEAFASGNNDAIETAKQSFAEIVQGATEGISDQSVIDYFNSMYPDLQEVVGGWEFEVKFKAAIDDDANDFENEVKDAIGKFDSSNSVLNFQSNVATQEQIDAYAQLNSIADEYNLTLEQLIKELEQLGLISSNVKLDLRNRLSNGTQNLVIDDWIATLTDEEASMANSTAFDEALKHQKEELDGAALSAENYSAALEEVKNSQDGLGNETGISPLSISQTIDHLNTQLKPAFDSLQSAYQDIFTDDGKFALNTIDILSTCDTIKSKLDDMAELGLDIDYSSYEDFVRVLRSSESTEQNVKDAFDSLAASITSAGLSGAEDFETLKAALEDLGVVNEELVAFESLANNTEALKKAGLDLAEATDEQINTFANEMVSAENVSNAIAILTFQKELCGLQDLNTAGEVANLLTLAENAGYTGEVIEHLTELEQIYQQIASGTLTPGQLDAKLARAEELRTLIKESAGKINYEPKVDFKGAGGKKSAGTAGKEAADTYLEAFEKELKDLDDLKSNGKISEKQYLDALRRLYVKYFNQKKKYLKEYEKYEHQYLEGMKSLYESAFSYITKQIDKRIDAVNSQKDAAVSALEAERDARLEAIEAQKEQYEHEIEGIEAQIDAREKEIKAMQDANGERKRAIDLQKAEYELQRMQNQKTSFVYKDGQMVYEADTSGIRDAKQEVEDAKLEIDISKIEKEIDRLEEEKDLLQERIDLLDKEAEQVNQYYDQLIAQTEKHYDAMVKGLEDYKSQFEALTDLLENAQMEASLSELGINMDALLSGSQEEFEKLKTAYIGILADMSRGNDGVLEQLSRLSGISTESISYLNATKGALEELGNVTLEGLEESIGGIGESASTLSTSAGEASAAAGSIQESVRNMSQSIAPLNTELGNLKTLIGELIALLNSITFPEIGEEGYAQKLMDMAQAFGEIASKCGEFKNIDFSSIIGSASAPSTDGAAMPGGEGMEGAAGTGFLGLASAISEAVASIGEQMGELKTALDLGNSYFTGQIDVINKEYIPAWENLRTRLAEIIGVEGGDSEDKEGRGKQEAGSTDGGSASGGKPGSIIDIMQTGGDAVDAKLEDPWLKAFNDFATDGDNSIQTICDKIIDLVTKMAEIIQKKCEAAASALHSLAKTAESSLSAAGGSRSGNTVSGNPIFVSPNAKGTVGHAFAEGTGKYKGLAHDEKHALRSEYGQPELTVYPDGTAELTTEPVLGSLPKGTVIFNEEQTKRIMNNKGEELGNTHVEDTVVTKDGRVLLPITPDNELYRIQQKFEAYFKENKGAFIDPAAAMFRATESMDRVIETISNNKTMHQNMITIGDIHLHEVQDAHSLSRELLLRFPNMLLQETKKV
ncbi:MAG: phage tail tape measure protein [Kineothrix sp.]|nr:phage tail tape measure protein [Kineothrix sp.]